MSLNDLLNDLGLQPKCHLLSAYQLIISVFEKLHVKIVMCSIHKENTAFISSLTTKRTFLPSAGQPELLTVLK